MIQQTAGHQAAFRLPICRRTCLTTGEEFTPPWEPSRSSPSLTRTVAGRKRPRLVAQEEREAPAVGALEVVARQEGPVARAVVHRVVKAASGAGGPAVEVVGVGGVEVLGVEPGARAVVQRVAKVASAVEGQAVAVVWAAVARAVQAEVLEVEPAARAVVHPVAKAASVAVVQAEQVVGAEE